MPSLKAKKAEETSPRKVLLELCSRLANSIRALSALPTERKDGRRLYVITSAEGVW
jgi:hypothetical protein